MFAQRRYYTLLDRSPASTTNRNAHFVVASQTIQFVHIVCHKAGTRFHFTRSRVQFDVARGALEVVAMIDFATEAQRFTIDDATEKNILTY